MAVTVQVPASSANLGPAFDCAAIALNLYLRARAWPSATGDFEVDYRGPNADLVGAGAENLIVRAIRNFAGDSTRVTGARIEVESKIPIGAGLGSSAAAIIAGTILGAEFSGVELEPKKILRNALALEKHPDNISAALYGGMAVAAIREDSADSLADIVVCTTDVSEKLDFIAITPDVPLSTEKARGVLPAEYLRGDVVRNIQRTALLAAAFFSGGDLTPEMFRDTIHQPFRAPLVPGIADCLEYRREGLAGIFLSGAGSSVMAIAVHSSTQIADELVEIFRRNGIAANAAFLKGDNRGAQITRS